MAETFYFKKSLCRARLSAIVSKKYFFQTSSAAILFHFFLKKSLPSGALGKGV